MGFFDFDARKYNSAKQVVRQPSAKPPQAAPTDQPPPSYAAITNSAATDSSSAPTASAKRYLALKARTLGVSEKNKKHSFDPLKWEAGRVAALLGIIDAPVEECTVACECHDEIILFAAELRKQDQEHEKTREDPKVEPRRSLNEQGMFEAYCGDIRCLCGMLRECKGEKVVEETDVEETGVVKADVEAMKDTIVWLKVKVKDRERRGIKWDKKTWLLPDCSEQLYSRVDTTRRPAA